MRKESFSPLFPGDAPLGLKAEQEQRTGSTILWSSTTQLDRTSITNLRNELPPVKREKADRFVRWEDRRDYVAAHAILHRQLDMMNIPASSLRIRSGGKPYLERASSSSNTPAISLTHTCGMVACAFSWDGEIGVDAEYRRRNIDLAIMARECLSAEEYIIFLKSVDPLGHFLSLWTLKEAVAKSTGLGLTLPFAKLAFSMSRTRLTEGVPDPERFQLATYTPSSEHCLAVAIILAKTEHSVIQWYASSLTPAA